MLQSYKDGGVAIRCYGDANKTIFLPKDLRIVSHKIKSTNAKARVLELFFQGEKQVEIIFGVGSGDDAGKAVQAWLLDKQNKES